MSTTPMEERVRQLELDAVEAKVKVEFLVKVVEDNTSAIKELTTVLNKGKGAAWAMAGVYTFFGGALTALISYLRG